MREKSENELKRCADVGILTCEKRFVIVAEETFEVWAWKNVSERMSVRETLTEVI